ncbi:MAG: YihY/virulence factor BrkB family protein [Chloroflexi bacterium]|nr:YihY/virulence factor BrkB family protein [Chloroflexota bacterium]
MSLKSAFQRNVQLWSGRVNRLRERLLGITAIRLVFNTVQELGQDEGAERAAAMSYYAILAVFPLLLGLIAVLGLFLPSETVQMHLFSLVQQNFPASSELLERNITSIIRLRGTLGIISIAGLMWTGSGLFGALSRSVNHAFDVKKRRPIYIEKPRQLVMALATGLLIIFSMGANVVFDIVANIDVEGSYRLADVGSKVLAFLLILLVFILLYKFLPNTETQWRFSLAGALLGAVLFEILRNLFIYYVNQANYQLVYGSVASIIALFVFAYFSSLILILGAEFASEFRRLRLGLPHHHH